MAERAIVSIHTTPETRERLDRLAHATKRTKSFLANEALEQYLALQEWQIAEIEQGLEEAKRCEFVSDEEMHRWFEEISAAGKQDGR